jgi:hypothetical protein
MISASYPKVQIRALGRSRGRSCLGQKIFDCLSVHVDSLFPVNPWTKTMLKSVNQIVSLGLGPLGMRGVRASNPLHTRKRGETYSTLAKSGSYNTSSPYGPFVEYASSIDGEGAWDEKTPTRPIVMSWNAREERGA